MFLTIGLFSFGQEKKSIPTFSSDVEKAAWIKANPQDYERLSGEKVTNSLNSGMTAEEKTAWIKANPEAYRAQGGNPEAVQSSEEPRVKEIVINPNDPTFPKFVMTGNPEQDAKDFEVKKQAWYDAQVSSEKNSGKSKDLSRMSEEEKALWIEKNPEEYQLLNNQSAEEEVLTPEQRYKKYNSKN